MNYFVGIKALALFFKGFFLFFLGIVLFFKREMAKMFKDAGGLPVQGNSRTAWDKGERFDFQNPEYR